MSNPLNIEVVSLVQVPEPQSVFPPEHRPVVLIVDDELVIANTLSAILSRNGFATLTAYDGKTALELAQVIPPELLITDVMMPGMNGIELAMSVVKEVPDCKVLLFSGHAATVDLLAQSRAMGHNFSLLAKPVHPSDLLVHVSKLLNDFTEEEFPGEPPASLRFLEGELVER